MSEWIYVRVSMDCEVLLSIHATQAGIEGGAGSSKRHETATSSGVVQCQEARPGRIWREMKLKGLRTTAGVWRSWHGTKPQ